METPRPEGDFISLHNLLVEGEKEELAENYGFKWQLI